jgi:hypothetical protein
MEFITGKKKKNKDRKKNKFSEIAIDEKVKWVQKARGHDPGTGEAGNDKK